MSSSKATIDQIFAGNAEAFGALVDEYKGAVFAVAYAKTLNFADAEDITQEAFIQAYFSLGSLGPPYRFGPWVCTIARNLALNWVTRKRPKAESIEAVGINGDLADTHGAPAEVCERSEELELVHDALQRLSPEGRTTTAMFYVDGYSYREIADLLQIPVGTVKSRLSQAREQLREEVLRTVSRQLRTRKPNRELKKRVIQYEAFDLRGKPVEAQVEAETPDEAIGLVRSFGLFPTSLRTQKGKRLFREYGVRQLADDVFTLATFRSWGDQDPPGLGAAPPQEAIGVTLTPRPTFVHLMRSGNGTMLANAGVDEEVPVPSRGVTVLGIPGSLFLARHFHLPVGAGDGAMAAAASLDVQQQIPFPFKDVTVSTLCRTPERRSCKGREWYFDAVKNAALHAHLDNAVADGMVPSTVVGQMYGMAAPFAPPSARSTPVCVVAMGTDEACICVCGRRRSPAYTRTLPFGVDSLAHAVQRALGVSLEEARAIRDAAGLRLASEPSYRTGRAMAEVMDALVAGITETLDHYCKFADYRKERFRTVLTGEGTGLPGLADALGARLDTKVVVRDPFDSCGVRVAHRLRRHIEGKEHQLTCALGLALIGMRTLAWSVPELPPRVPPQRRRGEPYERTSRRGGTGKVHGPRRVRLSDIVVPKQVLTMLPKSVAKVYCCVPVSYDGGVLEVAMPSTHSPTAIADLEFATGCEVRPALASRQSIAAAQRRLYGDAAAVSDGKS